MVDTREAIENVKSLARTFQSVIDLAAALEGVANVEQASRESKLRLDNLLGEVAKAQAARDDAEVATALALAQAAQIKEDTDQSVKRTLAQANEEAKAIVAGAKDAADNMVRAAQQAAGEAQDALTRATQQRSQAQADLADLEAKIERARAKMRDILGA